MKQMKKMTKAEMVEYLNLFTEAYEFDLETAWCKGAVSQIPYKELESRIARIESQFPKVSE